MSRQRPTHLLAPSPATASRVSVRSTICGREVIATRGFGPTHYQSNRASGGEIDCVKIDGYDVVTCARCLQAMRRAKSSKGQDT